MSSIPSSSGGTPPSHNPEEVYEEDLDVEEEEEESIETITQNVALPIILNQQINLPGVIFIGEEGQPSMPIQEASPEVVEKKEPINPVEEVNSRVQKLLSNLVFASQTVDSFTNSVGQLLKSTKQDLRDRTKTSGIKENKREALRLSMYSLQQKQKEILENILNLEEKIQSLVSVLADFHKDTMNLELSDVINTSQDLRETVEILSQLGVNVGSKDQGINPEGRIPSLVVTLRETKEKLEQVVLPTTPEAIDAVMDQDSATTVEEESLNACERIAEQLRLFLAALVEFVELCFDQLVFSFAWLLKRLGVVGGGSSTVVVQNPYQSYMGRTSDEGTSSIRTALLGRSDLSDHEIIKRSMFETVHRGPSQKKKNSQEQSGGDEGQEENK
ncbi:CT392 family protein [Candidatus Chlamydia sanziniae]|uniref:Uncharacterized protein n=1 Tax=Candidatus Chlamydia sanziniae TaxID=1806891 RepID=A0A1A9HV64_9CHLA|nr:hypothetical protein [Candidatus Chlamydia sanziniae]ANH78291.1 hypothetical protein Cs308_0120 [Candidatus Chlamydia sanziniae]